MVEFALVIPILLLVIMGIFAFAHLFFTYSTINSAAREGARIGSATGSSLINSTLPHYKDCVEIRNAVKRVGQAAGVDNDSEITISFIRGAASPPLQIASCTGVTTYADTIQSADRIVVALSVDYQPFFPFVNLPHFVIDASSARTIITNISIPAGP